MSSSHYLKKFFFFLLISCANTGNTEQLHYDDDTSWVLFAGGGGRLGDKLVGYISSKWIAYKNHLPLCSVSFPLYDQLMISELQKTFESNKFNGTHNNIGLKIYNRELNQTGCLYRVGFATALSVFNSFFKQMKKDKNFINELREEIVPKVSLKLIYPPKDKVSVAIHIRQGSGPDKGLISEQIFSSDTIGVKKKSNSIIKAKFSDALFPMKFPPEQYYVDRLKELSKHLEHPEMFAFIFTDSKDPQSLLIRIKNNVNLDNITYRCRTPDMLSKNPVLEDFFSLTNFNCLIRSGDSSFSKVAHLLGDFHIVIYPRDHHWVIDNKKHYLIMDDIFHDIMEL